MTVEVTIAAACLVVAAAVGLVLRRSKTTRHDDLAAWTVGAGKSRPDRLDVDVVGAKVPQPGRVLAVLFTHPECGGCGPLQRRLDGIDGLVSHVVDVSVASEIARSCGVDSVPTLVLVGSDGEVVRTWIGTPLAGTLEETVRSALSD